MLCNFGLQVVCYTELGGGNRLIVLTAAILPQTQ